MALAQQATPDLRDLFTVVNTIVLVVNIVLAVYIKGRFGPINEKLREHKAQIDANVLHICDIRENYLRKSRVDEELKMLDAQICSRDDSCYPGRTNRSTRGLRLTCCVICRSSGGRLAGLSDGSPPRVARAASGSSRTSFRRPRWRSCRRCRRASMMESSMPRPCPA